LKWTKASAWHLESDCKRYSVVKYIVNGKPKYQAIRKPDVSLLAADTADECKAACEGDGRG
jgi:hypothetical protein